MINFISNPLSGGKKGKVMANCISKLEAYLQEQKIEYTIYQTHYRGHAKELTEQLISEGSTNIVAIGGDGTLHEVINGFSNFENVTLGLIPCGTGNDFATTLNLPFDPVDALKLILNGEPKYTDFMQMPTVRGINIIGMGIDVDVLKRYENLKKKTKFGYTMSLVKSLMKFNYTNFTAEFPDEKTAYRSFIACVANGKSYGGGIPVCPCADPTDNMLDFIAIKEIPKIKIPSAFITLKRGNILKHKKVIHRRMAEIKITTPLPYTVNVDGELYDDIPFEVKIISNTLRFFR